MDTFVWDEHVTTGLQLVDEQHHRLEDSINQLGDSLIECKTADGDTLQAIFAQLADYAKCHFDEEERLMEESGIAQPHLATFTSNTTISSSTRYRGCGIPAPRCPILPIPPPAIRNNVG